MMNDKNKTEETPLMASPANGQTSNGHISHRSPSMGKFETVHVAPAKVHEVLERHLLADGLDLVVDLKKSKGSWIEDARSGKRYLDFFTFFGSSPIGLNHQKMFEPEFLDALTRAAINKPSSSDAYTVEMADFVETFARIAMPEYLPHLFLIEGGALAVENALKTAFDWKVRKNFTHGYTTERGRRILHFRNKVLAHDRRRHGPERIEVDLNDF